MKIDYEKANKAGHQLVFGCIVVGTMFALAALYMIWFGGAV